MKKLSLNTPIDKIEFIIYILNILLILLFITTLMGFIGISIFYLFYDLTNGVFQCIISIAICCFVLYACITNSKFKEIRKKFNNQIFEKRGNRK